MGPDTAGPSMDTVYLHSWQRLFAHPWVKASISFHRGNVSTLQATSMTIQNSVLLMSLLHHKGPRVYEVGKRLEVGARRRNRQIQSTLYISSRSARAWTSYARSLEGC
jgi:hypothetical protein